MTAYDRLVDRLRADGRKVTQKTGQARAKCPGHDGTTDESLSIRKLEDSVLIHCFGGCSLEAVLDSLGLTKRDLYDNPRTSYKYESAEGLTLRTVTRRYDRTGNKKAFHQSGDTKANILFRLPRVLKSVDAGEIIYLAEGEKDVLALETLGVTATTAPQGADSIGKCDLAPLGSTQVVAVAHKDEAGRKWAATVREKLPDAQLVEAEVGNDAADHIAAGLGLDKFVPIEAPKSRPTVVRLSDVKPERVSWLWPGRLPVGKLVIIDGDPSTGKSTLTLDIAAHVSRGGSWPDGAPCKAGDVLLLSAEDGIADTISPRLEAAGADRDRILALTEVPSTDDEGNVRMVPPSLPRDIPWIRQLVTDHKVKLIIVDVLMAFLGKVDSHKDQDIRGVLHLLATMAERSGCTIILIRHLNKAGGGNALYRGGGSIGIIGAARAAFLVARDPDDQDRRVFAVTKMNIAVEPPSLAYRLVSDESLDCARVEWESEQCHLKASDLLSVPDAEDAGERNEAAAWLEDFLMERGGSEEAGKTIRAASGAGISKTTLTRARKQAGVRSRKAGMSGGWVWEIEQLAAPEESTTPEESTEGTEESKNPGPGSGGFFGPFGEQVDSSEPTATPSEPDLFEHPEPGNVVNLADRRCPDCGKPVPAGVVRHRECFNRGAS